MDESRKPNVEEIRRELERRELAKMADEQRHASVYQVMTEALSDLRAAKPDDRSEIDRRYAVAITDLEKVLAYFKFWVVDKTA